MAKLNKYPSTGWWEKSVNWWSGQTVLHVRTCDMQVCLFKMASSWSKKQRHTGTRIFTPASNCCKLIFPLLSAHWNLPTCQVSSKISVSDIYSDFYGVDCLALWGNLIVSFCIVEYRSTTRLLKLTASPLSEWLNSLQDKLLKTPVELSS